MNLTVLTGVSVLGLVLSAQCFESASQAIDTLDLGCLSKAQQQQVLARSDELNEKLGVQKAIDRARLLMEEKEERRPIALDCKRRLESITLVFGASLSGCPQRIDQYNFTVNSLDSEMRNISAIQEIVKSQLMLERFAKWPACR
jgi:hypothetical protein